MENESNNDWGADSTRELSGEEIRRLLAQARAKRALREGKSSGATPAEPKPNLSKDSSEPAPDSSTG